MRRPPLTPRQAKFAAEFALDHCGAQAALRAGYSAASAKVQASRLLTKANVQAAVAGWEAEAAKALKMTREGVLAALQKAYEDARAQSNPAVMVAAVKQIILVCGFATPERKPAAVKVSPKARARMAELEAMSDEELMALAKGGTAN